MVISTKFVPFYRTYYTDIAYGQVLVLVGFFCFLFFPVSLEESRAIDDLK